MTLQPTQLAPHSSTMPLAVTAWLPVSIQSSTSRTLSSGPREGRWSLSALWQRESLFDEQGLLRVRGMIVEG
jgi:hypothetical protein